MDYNDGHIFSIIVRYSSIIPDLEKFNLIDFRRL